jgi:hypothetical protein
LLRFARKGKVFTGERLSPSKVRGIILSAAALPDKQIDPLNGLPKLEAVIPPPYNARITGLLPPWVASPEVTLRKPPRIIFPQGTLQVPEDYKEGYYNLEIYKKEIGEFRDETDTCNPIRPNIKFILGASPLRGNRAISPLGLAIIGKIHAPLSSGTELSLACFQRKLLFV